MATDGLGGLLETAALREQQQGPADRGVCSVKGSEEAPLFSHIGRRSRRQGLHAPTMHRTA